MGWRAYFGETVTGRVGAAIDMIGGSVDDVLNGDSAVSLSCSKASVDRVPRSFWAPWSGALVVTYEDDHTDGEVLMAVAPITKPPTETRDTLQFDGAGVGAILAQRLVTRGDYSAGHHVQALRASTFAYEGVTRGGLVVLMVQAACGKTNGALPIVYPPVEDGPYGLTLPGWDIANLNAWQLIRQLADEPGGPDVRFAPVFADGGRARFVWRLDVGSEVQPTLTTATDVVWDSTARDTAVLSMTPVSDASALCHRAYASGAGEGAGTALSIYQAPLSGMPEHMPLLERAVSLPNEDEVAGADSEASRLARLARSTVTTAPIDQLSLRVNSVHSAPFGAWRVGDMVRVVCGDEWLSVPPGEHYLRVIATRYDMSSAAADVELQPEALGDNASWSSV